MSHLDAITIHAARPAQLAGFWSAALGLPIDPGDAAAIAAGTLGPAEAVLLGDRAGRHVWVSPADELKPVGGRVHLDVRLEHPGDLDRLLELGAQHRWDDPRRRWAVYADPEGNLFCALPAVEPAAPTAVAGVGVRPLRSDDSEELAALYAANRAYLAPYEPVRDDSFFTAAGQAERVVAALVDLDQGRAYPYVIEVDGRLAGRVNVTNVSRGPFCNGSLGYWVAQAETGRGVASAAIAEVLDECFTRHDLHRVEAATLVDNKASQTVLRRNGFTAIGVAPRYLRIAGDWRDHLLFQRLADA